MFLSALRTRLAGADLPAPVAQDIRNLYIEIACASILGAVVTFNLAYAVRLGASNNLVALLSALPALLAVLTSIPSAMYLQTRVKRKRWIFGSLILNRLGYSALVFLPLLFPPMSAAVWLVVWVVALNLPAIFFSNGFNALLAELVPEDRRAFVFSRRSIIWSVGIVIMSALAGLWLDRVAFPLNYQLMYAFGVATSMLSSFFLNRLHVPDHIVAARKPDPLIVAPSAPIVDRPQLTKPMRRLLFNTAVYQMGLSLPAALFTIYYIETLKATDGWIGFNSAAAPAGVILGYLIWERLLRRHTYLWAIKRATLLTWIFPVGIAILPSLAIIPVLNLMVNMLHPAFDLSSLNVLYKLSDPRHRTVYMSWYATVVNLSTFAAPLLGAVLSGWIGIPAALIASGVIRIVGGLLFTTNPVLIPHSANSTRF